MNRFRVLIADDNEMVRGLLANLIQQSGDIEIVGEASDGYTAVELTKRLIPDAVIMDVNMPNMDGVQASRAIHSEFPNIQVIGLSMFARSEMAERMLEAGAVSYFSKSDPLDQVLEGIHQVLAPVVQPSLVKH